MQYYTLIIRYGSSTKPKVCETKNLGVADDENFTHWCSEVRRRVFTTGFNLPADDGTIDLISPFSVVSASLIKQPGKI